MSIHRGSDSSDTSNTSNTSKTSFASTVEVILVLYFYLGRNYTFITCVQLFYSSQMEQKLSWLQAHLFCQRHGANLLSISGPEEEHFVLQVLHEAFGWV